MNVSTNNISFNGRLTIQVLDKDPDISNFTNDVEVIKNMQEKVKQGKITDSSTTKDGDTLMLSCRVNDQIDISTRTFNNNTEKNDISITTKDKNNVGYNLYIQEYKGSKATPEELTKAINEFINVLQTKITETTQKAQEDINNFVISLLEIKNNIK